jgi:XTP/dITP diphosphohydrolase
VGSSASTSRSREGDLRRLLIATTNPGKLREIRAVLAAVRLEVRDLSQLTVSEADETGDTFAENARLKALHYAAAAATQWGPGTTLTVAEDSGLVIDALGGEPGVRSARYLRPDASYAERFADIGRRLALVPGAPRTARFVCALAAAREGEIVFDTTGIIEGEIAERPQGSGGFGYDPIFWYPPYGATLAEVTEAAKLEVAHRGRAFRSFADWLRSGATNGER